jgi:hypothetical protein
MKRHISVARTLLALLPLLMTASDARATASLVFVAAKSGSDANSCDSVATPCQTLAGVITQVSAGGEIVVLETGGYGPVTINKAVTINAPDGIVAFIHPPSGDAITIDAGSTDTVTLRGLTLDQGTGYGIIANTVGQLFIERCTVTGFASDGIHFAAAKGSLFMRDDDVRKCNQGVTVFSARAFIRDSTFEDNGNVGLAAFPGSIVAVTNCVAAGNSGVGFASLSQGVSNADMTLDRVLASSNYIGVSAGFLVPAVSGGRPRPEVGVATLRFANSVVTQNAQGIVVDDGGVILGSLPGTSVVAGNTRDISGTLGTAMTLR